MPAVSGATPAFGLNREQQMQQQELAAALIASMQASAKYQGLIQRANMQGMQQLQAKLAERAAPGRQIVSLKGLYDLWVEASEEAYAEIALSDEFRDAYGEMVNTQMRVRQLQQQQTEEMCRQLGVPTRSEVSSLGERLQALRRELRASQAGATTGQADDIMALRRELAAVKRQLAGMQAAASEPKGAVAKKAPKVARKPVATSKASASPRKRK
jgi:class III poly(R)-hydroxyalkanoic acid synthase PhaE subunit